MGAVLSDADVLARGKSIAATDLDDETVMMDLETGRYFHLDDIATAVWRLLETPCRLDALIARLLEEYDVTEDVCRNDTIELLESLLKSGAVRVVSDDR